VTLHPSELIRKILEGGQSLEIAAVDWRGRMEGRGYTFPILDVVPGI